MATWLDPKIPFVSDALATVAGGLNAGGGHGDFANTTCFFVMIDNLPLGAFDSADGLGLQMAVERVNFGSQNDWEPVLANRMTHTNIRLQRPVSWQINLTQLYFRYFSKNREKGTATIQAFHNNGSPIAAWSFVGVVPVKWGSPPWNLALGNAGVAYENIEIAHEGFL